MLILGGLGVSIDILNLGSHFAIFAGITSDNVDAGVCGWSDTQLGKSLCNFAGITSDNVDPGGGVFNWHSTWEVTLQLMLALPLTMLILGCGVDRHSTWEVTLQLCWDYLWQCWSWGEIRLTPNLGSHFATHAGITSDNVDLGCVVNQTLNLGSHFATLQGLPLTMLILGGGQFNWHWTWEVTLQLCWDYFWQCWSWWGVNQHSTLEVTYATWLGLPLTMLILGGDSIDTQLGKSLCNFAGITSDNVDLGGVNRHWTWEVTLQLCWDYLWQCGSGGGQLDTQLGKLLCNFAGITSDNVDHWGTGVWSTLNFGSHFATLAGITSDNVDSSRVDWYSTWEVTLQLGWDYLWQCWLWVGVNQYSTWEVTLQLCWDYLWQCWSWGVRGLINTQLGKSLCNFAWDYFWQCWSRGSIDTQLGKSLCNFAGITSDNVDLWVAVDRHWTWEVTLQLCWDYSLTMLILGGSIDTQLGRSLCNFAGITSDNVDLVGSQSTLNLGSHFATLLGLPLTMRILGGSIDTQLGKSLCNFAGITPDNVDPGWEGVNWHSSLEVTLQLCWDYLWQCWSWGAVISILNLGSYFATLLGLLLTMLIL